MTIKNNFKKFLLSVCTISIVLIASLSISSASNDNPAEEELRRVAAPLTSQIKISCDVDDILEALKMVKREKQELLIKVVAPLYEGFDKEDCLTNFCTSHLIGTLGKASPEDMPGYLEALYSVFPKPTNAGHTNELLDALIKQGSVKNAQAWVDVAAPLISQIPKEKNSEFDMKHLLKELGRVDEEKRRPIIKVVARLFAGFDKGHDLISLYTSHLIGTLGKASPEDMPGYLKILYDLFPEPTNAKRTNELLDALIKQGSVKKAQALVAVAAPLTSQISKEKNSEFYIAHLLEELRGVDEEKRRPIIEVVASLFPGFTKKGGITVLNTAPIIGTLGKASLEDMPGYLEALYSVFPKPTNAGYTNELLDILIKQGSVKNAQALIDVAAPLTSQIPKEKNSKFDIARFLKELGGVDEEKREQLIAVLVPLLAGFDKERGSPVLDTCCLIRTLGQVSLEDMPGYLKILYDLFPEPTNAGHTDELLNALIKQGSVKKAQALVAVAAPLTSQIPKEKNRERGIKYFFEALGTVNEEKREQIIYAVIPLFKRFDKQDPHCLLNTFHIIRTLSRVSLEDIPQYIKILHRFSSSELTNSEYTRMLLSTMVDQGSVKSAQQHIGEQFFGEYDPAFRRF